MPDFKKEKTKLQLKQEVESLRLKYMELKSRDLSLEELENGGAIRLDGCEYTDVERELKQERDYFENVLENSADAIGIVDAKGRFIRWNKRAEELFGYCFQELKGKSAFDLYADRYRLEEMLIALRKYSYVRDYEIDIRTKNGQVVPFEMSISILKVNGENAGSVCVARDLSQIKKVQAALRESNEKLEQRVRERTSELSDINKKLEEANIALRVLLEKKDENKRELEENMVFNVQQLIRPLIDSLKATDMDREQMHYLNLIESNLKKIISPFKRTLIQAYGLTPSEVQLLDSIKQGKSTKEIAEMLNLSKRTIDTHRHNIRKKLGLMNKHISLSTYLISAEKQVFPEEQS